MMLDSFIKPYGDRIYQHTAMVRHKGVVVAFAQDRERRIYYAALNLEDADATSPLDVNFWPENPNELLFPDEIAEVGVGIADQTSMPTVKTGSRTPVPPTTRVRDEEKDFFLSTTARLSELAPFQVLSNGRYIYVFRQAIPSGHADMVYKQDAAGERVLDAAGNPVPIVDGTLLVDRFVLSSGRLQTKMEVRYRRSRSRTRPQNRKDSLGAKDMEERPFFEPTQELRFVGGLAGGRFQALLLPTQVPGVQRWQVFAYNQHTRAIDSYNVEASDDGLFNTRGSQPETRDGHAESGLRFDSPSDRVALASGFLPGATFSLEAWIRPTKTGADSVGPLGQVLVGGEPGRNASGALSVWTVQDRALRIGFGDGSRWYEILTGKVLQLDDWNHLAIVFDGVYCRTFVDGEERSRDREATAYVDGQELADKEALKDKKPAATAVRQFGGAPGSFRGTLDEIRFWNRSRSRDEIRSDMHRRLTGREPGLGGYWRFDEASGDTIHDQTDSDIRGLRHGGTWVTSDAPVGVSSGLNRNSFHLADRSVESGMTALLYFHQENEAVGYDGRPKPVKHDARVMLAMATRRTGGSNPEIVALDFGVSATGRLAQIPDRLDLRKLETPTLGGESIEAKLERLSTLGQKVTGLEADVVNLTNDLAEINHAVDLVNDALVSRSYRTDIQDPELSQLNDRISALQSARADAARLDVTVRERDSALSTARATFHEHIYFRGRVLQVGRGFFSYRQLSAMGFNDLISSIQIPEPLQVTVYEHENRRGRSLTHNRSTVGIGPGWNDIISEIEVAEDPDFRAETRRIETLRDSARQKSSALAAELTNDVAKLRSLLRARDLERQAKSRELTTSRSLLESLRGFLSQGVSAPMPLVHTDPFGLSITGAVLGFAWSQETPQLFDSATGKLALYFRGADDQFFVIYYDTLTQRARYQLADDRAQECVICTARSTAPEMDALSIAVEGQDSDDVCTVEIRAADIEETWTRVPRDPAAFARVLNGRASERAYLGAARVIVSEGRAERLLVPEGVRRNLALGSTLRSEGHRFIVRDAVQKGATEIPVDSGALDLPSHERPLFFLEYDYVANARTNKVPANLSDGSLLIRAASIRADRPLQVAQTLRSGSTINSQWVAAAPGYTLAFDGAQSTVGAEDSAETSLRGFAAASDVTVEAWVRPGEITDADRAVIVQHASATSRYAVGLLQRDLVSALQLDGAAEHVLIAHDPVLDFAGAITLEAWIRPEAFDGIRNILAHGFQSSPDAEVFLRIADGRYEVGAWNGAAQLAAADIPEEDRTGLDWVHLAGVYDGASWKLYRNGALLQSTDADLGALSVSAPWAIGARGSTPSERFFAGCLDDVRIWKRARLEKEIRADMRRRLSGIETDLVGYWHFEDGIARDYSRHGNDGTLVGAPGIVPSALPAYVPFARVGDKSVQARQVTPAGSWTHLASVFNQSHALEFNGSDGYLDCGSDSTLNITRDLTVEVFVRVDATSQPCGLLSRGRLEDGTTQDVPYCLYIHQDRKLVFAFEDTSHRVHQVVSSRNAVTPGQPVRLAVTRKHETQTIEQRDSNNQIVGADVVQWTDIRLYADGTEIGYTKYEGPDAGSSNQLLEIGRAGLPGFQEAYLDGIVSEVRIWNTARAPENLGADLNGNAAGLVAWWRFEENDGNVAYDNKATNHARIHGGVRWVKNPDAAASGLLLYRDGISLETEAMAASNVPQPEPQFTLGALGNRNARYYYQGELEEVRIWRTARTQEQIHDNLFRRVLGEKEDLIAYYPFDSDPTGALSDHSFLGNDLVVRRATYVLSTAPIGEDTPQVRSALASIRTPFNGLIQGRPGIVEYGDLQNDVDGNLIGVLKRCYSLVRDGQWQLITGFKVGNLRTEWLGQVQFAPQLIGYIEGAPPAPSENLTTTGTVLGEFDDYNGATAIELTEADSTTYTYAASKDRGFDMSVESKIGLVLGAEAEAGFGLIVETVDVENVIGAHLLFEHSLGWLEDAASGSGFSTARLSRMELRGGVENVEDIAHPAIGRRFVPENYGFALVQSDTADVFGLRLEHNNALISLRMRPNPDIPKDRNIITFPIDPMYTKQGSLDGKIGFDADANYPNALTYSSDSSYFKPIEAYALKNRIQREEERLRTYFDQYDAGALGRRQAHRHFSEGDLAAGRAAEKLPKIEKRNLVNTYVWTADGGLFAESEDVLDLQQETVGGSYQFKGLAGVYTDLTVAVFGVGIKFELDALFGGHLDLTVTKSVDAERSFGMNVDLSGVEGDLYRRDEDGAILIDRSDPLNPKRVKSTGKVDAYRFMTFYLEPETQHFDHFFSRVVDPIWLEQSDEPNAVALREARQVDRKPPCWRVMHRVTFVSRILPPLSDTVAPPLERTLKKLDIDSNYELIKLLEPFVINESTSFAEFGQNVRSTLRMYHPELLPHASTIIRQLSLYYDIADDALATRGAPDDDPLLDAGSPLDMTVDAGPESSTLAINGVLALEGSLEHSQQPLENLLVSWSRSSGPGQVVFSNPDSLQTSVTFGERGLYTLRLTVDDGLLSVSDEVVVAVNKAPEISAGDDLDLRPRERAELVGAIRDDGLGDPSARDAIQIRWSQISGPGDVVFSDDSSLRTAATFSRSGSYLLRLTVDNGSFDANDEVMVAVAARVTRDLQVLYVFEEGGGTTVRDVAAVASPLPLAIGDSGAVEWVAGGLVVRRPAALQTQVPIARMLEAIRRSDEITVEAWIMPAQPEHPGLARIVTCSSGPAARNFVLAQRGSEIYAALRTDSTNDTGSDRALAAGLVKPATLMHVVVTRDAFGAARLYLDGHEVASRIIAGAFSSWDPELPLALANEVGENAIDDRAWLGELALVAVYSRALTSLEIAQNFDFGANTNLSPVVAAGPDQMIDLPGQATVSATIIDDSLLADQIGVKWTQASGPSSVAFETPDALTTAVTFDRSGRYVLRLTATEADADSQVKGLSASDEVVVRVNQAPTIEAGGSQALVLGEPAQLRGALVDDGLAEAAAAPDSVQLEWSQVDGPSSIEIVDAASLQTELRFSEPGEYAFRLTADNGRLPPTHAETRVFVNREPQLRATADSVVTMPVAARLASEEDLGLFDPNAVVTRSWSQVRGSGEVTFADSNAATTTATFSKSGIYVLRLTVETSGEGYRRVVEDEVTLTANRAPVVAAGPDRQVLLPAGAELEGTVSDDGFPDPPGAVSVQWSKLSGPGEVTFSDAASAYTTARFTARGSYELQLEARDYAEAEPVVDQVRVDVHSPPRVAEGLQALYRFEEGEGNSVRDVSEVGDPFDLVARPIGDDDAALEWLGTGLRIVAPAILEAQGPLDQLFAEIIANNEITLEAWVKRSAYLRSRQSPRSILSFSLDTRNRNFVLAQTGAHRYEMRLRTTETDAGGLYLGRSRVDARQSVALDSEICHLVYTRDRSGQVRFYKNGTDPQASRRAIPGSFESWGSSAGERPFRFALGNELTGTRPWLGEYHLAAIYSRALTESEVLQNFDAGV